MNNAVELTDTQIQSWQKDGYFISDLIIEDSVLEEMRTHVDMVFNGHYTNDPPFIVTWKPGDHEDKIRQMAYGWRTDPVLEGSAKTREIGAIAAQLQQTDTIRLLMDWLVYKPGIGNKPSPQTGVGWHQDQAYWLNTYPQNLISARINLDHETVENGCMNVIPGSHKWGLQRELIAGFWKPGEDKLPPRLDALAQGDHTPRQCELLPGQIMFHHCMMIHGTGQNRTNKPRRSQNIHMMPSGTLHRNLDDPSFFAGYAQTHGQKLGESEEMRGELFPVIYPVAGNDK